MAAIILRYLWMSITVKGYAPLYENGDRKIDEISYGNLVGVHVVPALKAAGGGF